MRRFILFAFFALISKLIVNSVYAQFDIQNFNPTEVPTIEESENTEATFRPTIPPRPIQCASPDELADTVKVGNILVGNIGPPTGRVWYASSVSGGNLTAEELLANIKKIKKKTGLTVSLGFLRQQLAALPAEGVACISTGVSPSIFIYSPNTKVQPIVPILYLEQNNQYIYYEYDSTNISFNKPKYGWIIEKNSLSDFTSKIANDLKLTKLEKERLGFELNFSSSDVKSDKLFIGLISQVEIDKNIPLKIISPNNPKVLRYHFYISKVQTKEIKQPKLKEIQRNKPFILEFGSFAKKQ